MLTRLEFERAWRNVGTSSPRPSILNGGEGEEGWFPIDSAHVFSTDSGVLRLAGSPAKPH